LERRDYALGFDEVENYAEDRRKIYRGNVAGILSVTWKLKYNHVIPFQRFPGNATAGESSTMKESVKEILAFFRQCLDFL
jgi:hypothetical protein